MPALWRVPLSGAESKQEVYRSSICQLEVTVCQDKNRSFSINTSSLQKPPSSTKLNSIKTKVILFVCLFVFFFCGELTKLVCTGGITTTCANKCTDERPPVISIHTHILCSVYTLIMVLHAMLALHKVACTQHYLSVFCQNTFDSHFGFLVVTILYNATFDPFNDLRHLFCCLLNAL